MHRLSSRPRIPALGIALLLILAVTGTATAQKSPAPDCNLSAAEVYRRVSPSVTTVISLVIDPFRASDRVSLRQGSGVALAQEGLVATNFHVIADAQWIGVETPWGLRTASVVGGDPIVDLAVIRVDGGVGAGEPMAFAPSDAIEMGQPVYVVGYPLGIGQSISAGIVSGLGRVIPLNTLSWLYPYIQTDAAVSRGNSGGALADGCGRLVGLVTLTSHHPDAENIAFAIPVGALEAALPELIASGRIARPWHGLYGQTYDMAAVIGLDIAGRRPAFREGFLVETVEPGSAADRAGLRGGDLPVKVGAREIILGGDIIVEVDGRRIRTAADAVAAVRALRIGDTVEITFLRGDHEFQASVRVEERPTLERDLEPYRAQR